VSRILVAEDETRIASFVEKGLGAAGFAVTVTADGPAALAEAQSGQFDLMILDIGLPGRDGFDILQTLRGEGNPIAVIVLTARDSAPTRCMVWKGAPTTTCPSPSASMSCWHGCACV